MTTATDREPGTLSVIRLVAARELGERLRAKSFYILTGLLVLLIIAIGVGLYAALGGGSKHFGEPPESTARYEAK